MYIVLIIVNISTIPGIVFVILFQRKIDNRFTETYNAVTVQRATINAYLRTPLYAGLSETGSFIIQKCLRNIELQVGEFYKIFISLKTIYHLCGFCET